MTVRVEDDHLPEAFFSGLFPASAEPAGPAGSAHAGDEPAAFLTRLLDHLPGMVTYFDLTLTCRFANRAARQHRNPDASALAGLPIQQVFVPELLDALLPGLAQALRGQSHAFEARLDDGVGGQWLASAQLVPDLGPQGVTGVFCHVHDAGPLRAVAGAHPGLLDPAELSEQRLRLMLDGLREHAVFFLDAHGRVAEWSSSAERMLGYHAGEAPGMDPRRFDVPMGDQQDGVDAAFALERAGLFGQFERTAWQRRKDGSRFWAHTVLTALRDPITGDAVGFSCLMRDMTEVRRLQELLQELNQTLEQRVLERTQQLQEANRDLESFSSSVSHDLRAPLRHIGSFVELLQAHLGPQADATTRRHLDTIAGAARRMAALIEGLLAFSRLGLAPLDKRQLPMAAQVSASINRLSHDLGPQAVDWALADDLPDVWGDALLLSQVWDNLLGNAVKYSRTRDRSQVAVGWRSDPALGQVFWVRDNGVGFDPRQSSRLFGVFQRLHREADFEGTGIGLALCRRILERHGGRIWAEGVPQQGCTVYFSLPLPLSNGQAPV